jgi:hypothetical protein
MKFPNEILPIACRRILASTLVKGRLIPVAAIILCWSLASWAQSSFQSRQLSSDGGKPLPSQDVPESGTFWSLQRTNYPPLPFNLFPDLPVYYLGYGNAYLVDDSSVDFVALAAERDAKRALRKLELQNGLREADEMDAMEEEGGGLFQMAYDYPTSNALWLEITQVTNEYAHLTLHDTVDTNWYQLLSVTNLTPPRAWQLGELRVGDAGTNQTVFNPVFVGEEPNMFFRAQQANGYIFASGGQVAFEPTAAMPGSSAAFSIYSSFAQDVTVYYELSGTAENGVDYTNLTGVLTIPAYQSGTIEVQPKPDATVEGPETVILTLLQTNDYLIEPTLYRATNIIKDYSTLVAIYTTQGEAIEPHGPSGQSGQNAEITLGRSDENGSVPPLPVMYSISGTASNGNDYATLTGSVTFGDQQLATNIVIAPLADLFIEGNESVTLTLVTTNTFEIQSGFASAAATIRDDLFMFQPVLTNLPAPVGIDYHQPSNCLIVSVNYVDGTNSGEPYNFARIYTNHVTSNSVVVMTNIVVTNWSGIHGVQDEIKLFTVKTTGNGYTNGDVFFGNGPKIGKIAADGGSSNLNWCILTNNTLPLRGGLCLDETGVFSNHVIAVTSGSFGFGNKGIWRADGQGNSALITNVNTSHLEGAIVLTTNTAKWGPWAGKLITGDEGQALIYTVSTNGTVTNFDTPSFLVGATIRPEDFDIIPPDQDLYACDGEANMLVKLSRNYLTNYVGDLLITDAGETAPASGAVFILHWDANTTNFAVKTLNYFRPNGARGKLEHATFSPIDFPTLTP